MLTALQPKIACNKFGQCQKFGTISQLVTAGVTNDSPPATDAYDTFFCVFFVQPADSEIHDKPKFPQLYSVASCEFVGFIHITVCSHRKNSLTLVCLRLCLFSAHVFRCSHFSAILTGRPIIFSS